jgi:transcriptional regulator with XRE-family HTH domain
VPTSEAQVALEVLGQQIRLARKAAGQSAERVAVRCRLSERTVLEIEKGSPSASIGNVFNLALTLGVPLFGASAEERERLRAQGREKIALIGDRVRPKNKVLDDDF